jgi:hypothetical protein
MLHGLCHFACPAFHAVVVPIWPSLSGHTRTHSYCWRRSRGGGWAGLVHVLAPPNPPDAPHLNPQQPPVRRCSHRGARNATLPLSQTPPRAHHQPTTFLLPPPLSSPKTADAAALLPPYPQSRAALRPAFAARTAGMWCTLACLRRMPGTASGATPTTALPWWTRAPRCASWPLRCRLCPRSGYTRESARV